MRLYTVGVILGTTSFGFRYLLLDRTRCPGFPAIFERTAALGLQALQVCENARPMELSDFEWSAAVRHAQQLGIEVFLGCKTLDAGELEACLLRAAALPSRMLRVVFEQEGCPPPSRAQVDRLLAGIWPVLDRAGARLAIENHFDMPCRVLAAAVSEYPAAAVGFCVDTANSLRNFEPPELVMQLLGDRAFCYHLKDYRVDGHMLGFQVGGAPLGSGKLDAGGLLDAILSRDPNPLIFLENWVSQSGDWERDVAEDETWLRTSLDCFRQLLQRCAIVA